MSPEADVKVKISQNGSVSPHGLKVQKVGRGSCSHLDNKKQLDDLQNLPESGSCKVTGQTEVQSMVTSPRRDIPTDHVLSRGCREGQTAATHVVKEEGTEILTVS